MKYGASMCYTEMVNSKAFMATSSNPIINQWYTTSTLDRPLVVQICGDNPETMASTCLVLQDYCDAIDINLGCPQEVAKKGHYGSFLQDEWDLIRKIIKRCSEVSRVPIFVKIRVFDCIDRTVDYAKMIQEAGARLITVHGRTRDQKGIKSGMASWRHIRAVKDALSIPVVANGNIIHNEDIKKCHEATNCDGVMSAETHLYNPLIFTDIKKTSLEIMREYLDISKNIANRTKEQLYNRNLTAHLDMGCIKSHSFKILTRIFIKMPQLREKLGKCRILEDYYEFVRILEELYEFQVLEDGDLTMAPNIREISRSNNEI